VVRVIRSFLDNECSVFTRPKAPPEDDFRELMART
jgi:hypothetical protein